MLIHKGIPGTQFIVEICGWFMYNRWKSNGEREMGIIQSDMYDDSKYLIMDTVDVVIDGDKKGNTLEMAMLIAEQYIVFCQPEEDVIVVSEIVNVEMQYMVQLDKVAECCNIIMEDGDRFIEYLNAVSIELF